ncbi:MAG: Do family serine endopeptidase [Planctomycetota bacterium]
MRIGCVVCIGLIATALVFTDSARAQADGTLPRFESGQSVPDELRYATALSSAFNSAAKRVEPAVVHITSQRLVREVRRFWGRRISTGEPQLLDSGLGSGVIVDESGIILTNHHVIDGADVLIVRLSDEREFEAELVGSDPATDVAVLKIDAPDLVAAHLGDSDDVDVGEWVLAIGSPFGFDRTVTAGIISARGRSGIGEDNDILYQDFLQTDASINPGNSGGPLISLDGAVIGINTAIASRGGGSVGIGFAIPANMARGVAELLLRTGRVQRGWLGVSLQDLDPTSAREFGLPGEAAGGVLVTSVNDGTPAANAGLQPGDVIMRFDDRPAETLNRLRNLIAFTAPGEPISVEVLRGGKRVGLRAELIDWADGRAMEWGGRNVPSLGAIVVDIDRNWARRIGLRRLIPGALIVRVEEGGPAGRARLQPGDVIIGVGRREIDGADDLAELLESGRGSARFSFVRNNTLENTDIELR